jgi:hypothetical protein
VFGDIFLQVQELLQLLTQHFSGLIISVLVEAVAVGPLQDLIEQLVEGAAPEVL